MWRGLWSGGILRQTIGAAVGRRKSLSSPPAETRLTLTLWRAISECSPSYSSSPCYPHPATATATATAVSFQVWWRRFSSSTHDSISNNTNTSSNGTSEGKGKERSVENITFAEAKKLMRLVNVESLKMKLGMKGKEVIGYSELLEACESMGFARSLDEAVAFARVLDEAGVVLLFRNQVYLHPEKVVDLVRRAVPLALTSEDDPMRDELKRLQEKKEEIDVLAHKQVTRILWTGLGLSVVHVGLFFRLTFWEFSWDVMEPIAFFTTATGIVIGYAYFLFTARDPTYQDLMKRLFLSRQRKLINKQNFDVNRFKELQIKCKTTLDANASIRNRVGLELELEDALHRD